MLDPNLTSDESHVAAAMVLGGAIVLFAMLVSVYLDRAQHQLVSQNRDLTVTHAVSSAVRGGLSLPDLLEQSLDRVVTETGALAGIVTVEGADDRSLTIRRPATLAPGLAWLGPVLDEAMDPAVDAPRYTSRSGIDTGVMDLPLIRGTQRIGHIRLAFHPPVEPDISDAAFTDIAGEIAGAAQLGMTVANLHRREREREALHAVALQLTGRAELKDVLDTITQHARDLLGAERAVACLSDPRATVTRIGFGAGGERLAMADDGSMCRVAHEKTAANHPQNPQCPLIAHGTDIAWIARPLRGPEGVLGELCVARPGQPFTRSEKDLLGALADMAAIAVRQARLHEAEEQWTIHAERDRIARELHDSLAQVLGVIHLQLRSLEARAKDEASLGIADELVRPGRDGRRGLQRRPRGDPGPPRDGPRGRRPGGLAARVPAQVQPPDGHRGDASPARATPGARSARDPRSSSCAWSRRPSPMPASTRTPPGSRSGSTASTAARP